VKYCLFAYFFTVGAFAQQQEQSYRYDVNGRPVENVRFSELKGPGMTERRQTTTSVNGRSVPIQSTEDRVVSDSGGTKVIERIVKKFDANGNPGPAEKVRIEEHKNPDGSGTIATTVLRGDLNGNYQVAERTKAEIRKSGSTTETNTTIERPTVNGTMDVLERREESRRDLPGGSYSLNTTVSRKDSNGHFFEAARETQETTVAGAAATENAAVYEASPQGGMQLVNQTVSRIVTNPDKSQHREISIYDPNVPGRVGSASGTQPRLREQQIVDKTLTSAGAKETVSVRRTDPSDPSKLGSVQKVAETVCSGVCK